MFFTVSVVMASSSALGSELRLEDLLTEIKT